MKLAIVSDIHSNIAALRAVISSIRERGCERILCLGDTVGYNANPNECVEALTTMEATVVQGNHDWAATTGHTRGFNPIAVAGVEYSKRVLTVPNKDVLAKLPTSEHLHLDAKDLKAFHGSPRDPLMEYLFPSAPAPVWKQMAAAAGSPDVVALGHTHLPMAKPAGGTLFVNPGSVGQPRDGDPRASYGILDVPILEFEVVRVEYDIEATARANRAAGLPEQSWQRLFKGS